MIRYKSKRGYELSPELAYCVGLLAADGCLSSDGRHIDFTSKDYEQVQVYRQIVCPHAKIGTKRNGQGQTAYRVQLGSVAFYDFLISLGLTPRKSKTIGKLAIPDDFYSDFLRGYFDGDGTTYGFQDMRWKNSFMYYTVFISASTGFLEWLRLQNTRLMGTTTGSLRSSTSAFVLSYAKADSQILYSFMYYNEVVPRLFRKQTKLQTFFAADPYL